MKVILVFVATLNGKITRGNDPEVRHWSSKSDQEYYSRIWKESRLVVMGSNTWNQNIITPSGERLIIVMTGEPGKYKAGEITGQLEFTGLSPLELVQKYRNSGSELMTVVGGSLLATSFLKESLIDEIWLTLEPRLFGKGYNLLSDTELDVRLKLITISQANEEGTLITRYSVVK
jgi:dihydrofolate reductase